MSKEKSATTALIDPKEMTAKKAQVTKASNYATSLQVETKEDYEAALEEGKKIKDALTKITARKEDITRPLNDALKSTRALFKPLETGLEDALATIKGKMTTWYVEAKRKEDHEKAKIAADLENGKIKKPETAIRKMGEVEGVDKVVETDTSKASMRTVRKVRFTPANELVTGDTTSGTAYLISNGYLVWNEVKARKDALAGIEIPGVEVYEDQELAIGGQKFKDTNLE